MRGLEGINIYKHGDLRQLLGEVFRRRCLRSRYYSLRCFARDLKISSSSLSRLLNGLSSVRPKSIEALAQNLELNAEQLRYFCMLLEGGRDEELREIRRAVLFQESSTWPEAESNIFEFSLVILASLWDGFRIEELVEFYPDLDAADILSACRKLQGLGWLQEQAGLWLAPYGFLRKNPDNPSESVRQFHRKILLAALEKLDHAPIHERYFYTTLFSLPEQEYAALCRKIESFALSRSDATKSREQHDRVYSLSIQLVPVTGPFPSIHARRRKALENPSEFRAL